MGKGEERPATRIGQLAEYLARSIEAKASYLTPTDEKRVEQALNSVKAFIDLPPGERVKFVKTEEAPVAAKEDHNFFRRVAFLRQKAKREEEENREWVRRMWARMAAAEKAEKEQQPQKPERQDPTQPYVNDFLRKDG